MDTIEHRGAILYEILRIGVPMIGLDSIFDICVELSFNIYLHSWIGSKCFGGRWSPTKAKK